MREARARVDFWILAILAIAFLIRLYGITNPLVDFSSWRQVDTASIARNFIEHDFNILRPQLQYDGPGPNYCQLEFQITTFIIAILYMLIGVSDLYARLVPILFYVGATLYLYLFTKRYTDRLTAYLTPLVFSILPLGVYYGRTVQPESAMLFFGVASLYYFSIWCEKQTAGSYVIATLMGALSTLAKLPNLFLLIPLLAIAWGTFGGQTIKNRWVILYFAIVIAATAGYFGYAGWLVETLGSPYDYHNYVTPAERTGNFVSNITKKHILPQLSSVFASKKAAEYFITYLPGLALTPIGLILLCIGLIPIRAGKIDTKLLPFYTWAAAMLVYAAAIVANIRLDYYLVPILPIASFFIARALSFLGMFRVTSIGIPLLIAIIGYQSYYAALPLYDLDKPYYIFGTELQQELRPNDTVILGTYNPAILYYSGHRGWRSDDLSLEEFKYLQSEGAGYYVPLRSAKDKRLIKYLEEHFEKKTTTSGCVYYDLRDAVGRETLLRPTSVQ